jgi:3'-phosphoadenosine 5'-phosphosulfate sulfotransferase (PAPS reductase)/FAD synthetase
MQLELFPVAPTPVMPQISLPDFDSIDHWILAFSGGKDSIACLIWLIENVDRTKIELWHHEVDGDGKNFVDWPCTGQYVKGIAKAFELPIYFSGLCGGFKGELLKHNQPHAPSYFETPEGLRTSGGKGAHGTRLKFPAKVASLRTRWCSSALKIDVAKMSIANQPRFLGKTIVVVTGERWQESAARSKYARTQYYCQPNSRRTVYQFRPVLDWSIEKVWESIARYKINPHPAYKLGFGRVSCRTCIFASNNQWATIQRDFPDAFAEIVRLEEELQHTIDSKRSVLEMANLGTPYPLNLKAVIAANSLNWNEPVFLENWELPSGALGEQNGSI